MLLSYRNPQCLCGSPWFMLELSDRGTDKIESTSIELALRRLVSSIPEIFGTYPCELFIPVIDRDVDTFQLASGPFVYVRGEFKKLLKLKRVNGFKGLYTLNETGRSQDAMPCEDSYVQDLIAMCEGAYRGRWEGIKKGSVVRLLDGETRDFVGEVTKIEKDVAEVRVILLTKELHIKTPVGNCRLLDTKKKVFYYTKEEECSL